MKPNINEIKVRAQTVNNFKNPPKTLIRIVQCSQSVRWGRGDATTFTVETCNGETINLLGTAEFCAGLFLCTAEFNANYV